MPRTIAATVRVTRNYAAVGDAAGAKPADVSNLAACVDDARRAVLDSDPGPPSPTVFHQLIGRLEASRDRLPPLYREVVFAPYTETLRDLGPNGFADILIQDPTRERAAGLMLDIAQAILQNGERFEDTATDGFQEVVSDLYDGFLSAEDRIGVKQPDHGVIPPLVKWGNPDFGPYTWPIDATSNFNLKAAIVNMPPAHTRRGLLAWAALGHETAGHDILHADDGLQAELADKVRMTQKNSFLGSYWSSRIDETASDVMGILNMGPAAGIGLIGYFRGIRSAGGQGATLSSTGSRSDPHPADILRGFLAASTIERLIFDGSKAWAAAVRSEARNDAGNIALEGVAFTTKDAEESADAVAEAIVRGRMKSLEGKALGDIQNWRDVDEETVSDLRGLLTSTGELPRTIAEGIFAAHVVAAAVNAALAQEGEIALIFTRMKTFLKVMHDANPSWGPLFVTHPGNLVRHRAI